MFCLLPTTKCKQQQIAILIISFFLYVNGIRNEGNNMLLQQQQQQQQPLHTPIENSNYQSHSSSNSVFQPSPLIEFTLADVTQAHGFKATFEDGKYPTSIPPTPTSPDTGTKAHMANKEGLATKIETHNDNRRYSEAYTNAEQQYSYPNEQQQHGFVPQQQQSQYQYQDQQEQEQQQQQQQQHFTQQLTEMPIYIYKDPYTNENYHYTPTEANNVDVASPAIYTPNDYNGYGYQQQQQQQQQYQPAATSQDNQEYLVHSSMLVGTQHQQQKQPSTFVSSAKDVYQKRPGLVYDESYASHPNSVQEKKPETAAATKINKISYDSHDYPPPSYHQQQTSNFLPTPAPEVPPTPRPTPAPVRPPPVAYYTTPTPPPARPPYYATATSSPVRPPLSYVTHRPPPSQDYRPRPPPHQAAAVFGHHQQHQQEYLQSSQNALPNYANNLDNYLSNKQQTEYYRPERPPAYLQQQQHRETIPPPFRQQQQSQQYQPSSYPSYAQQQQESSYPSYTQQQQQSSYPSYTQQQQQQSSYPSYENPQYHQQPSSPPSPPPPSRPSYNNYYDYQIGEVPPQTQGAFNYPYPRPPSNGPYRPPYVPPTQQPSGLATLVQYAPQFTSLLLGGGGGGGGGASSNSNSLLGSLLGALTGARPVNSQLIKALENIARNDDLQCVPKVLCQMIAAQTQRGQLPSFITSPTITNFLAGFPASSPALIYGRAALLGISGGDKSCHRTYVQCPKNEFEIINYLNNHRGGFFKFFSEPDEQSFNQHNGNHDSSQSGASSLFSILAALTGTPPAPVTTPRPKPKPQPQPASSDITGTIGNFFTNLLSDYMGEGATVEYQRRRRRSTADKRVRFEEQKDDGEDEHFSFNQQTEDYNDDEDSEDTQQNVEFTYEPEYADDEDESTGATQARVVHRPSQKANSFKFFPEADVNGAGKEKTKDNVSALIEKFNEFNKGRKLKFPSVTEQRQYIDVAKEYLRDAKDLDFDDGPKQPLNYGHQFTNYQEDTYDKPKDTKKITFYDEPEDEEASQTTLHDKEIRDLSTAESTHFGSRVKFPEREGKILNRPYYAASFSYNRAQQQANDDKFIVPSHQRPRDYQKSEGSEGSANIYNNQVGKDNKLSQRPYDYSDYHQPQIADKYNYDNNQPQRPGVHNTHVTTLNSINNYVSNAATNNNFYGGPSSTHFLPTPPPETDIDEDYNNDILPNNNFHENTNQNFNRYTNNDANKAQSYTTSTSSNNDSNRPTYNSYRPLRNPQSSNSHLSNSYSSNSNTNPHTNRYHSSLYTTRRPTTTTKASNDNVYITNARGETEYYIRPDGRKIYL